MLKWLAACFLCISQSAMAATSPVVDYYESILGRAPDAAGQAYWEGEGARLQSLGVDVREAWRAMAIAFLESPEYAASRPDDAAFISDLYAAFFQRSADGAGLDYWTGQLRAGLPRAAATLSFLFSPEFDAYTSALAGAGASRASIDLVVDFYRGLLGRLPDTSGLSYWNERLRAAQCVGPEAVAAEADAISSLFLASAEYAARRRSVEQFVSDLYNAFMRRGADLEGVRFWVKQLQGGGSSAEDLRRAFRDSPEFQARVSAAVREGCIRMAASSNLSGSASRAGAASPFVGFVEIRGLGLEKIDWLRFAVASKPGAASRPVRVGYSRGYLIRGGYVAGDVLRVPVFGLYAGYSNAVSLEALFEDGSSRAVAATLATGPFVDPAGIYDRPSILVPRAPGSALGFDYFYMKGSRGYPVVVDTDGEVRWWMPDGVNSFSSTFVDGAFLIGDPDSTALRRLALDGRTSDLALTGGYTGFHHNFDRGKLGILAELDDESAQPANLGTLLVEIAADGTLIREWNLAEIIAAHMRARGDDPAAFVRPGVDWFHMNAAAYDRRDDTLVVSSRENFVVKLDYATGAIAWILGDPQKYWYGFRSLREKALRLEPGGLYPIGQHAVTFTGDGLLMMFNNGVASLGQPPGAPAGESRAFSAVSAYVVDPIGMTAREAWRFDYGASILSGFCSSAYEAASRSLLVTYAFAESKYARLVGLDGEDRVAFDFRYDTRGCGTSWNAEPIAFDDMAFN